MFFSQQKTVRTRFAPSPTGELHIGGARTALFAYLFARQNKGKFFLRIEDTDLARLVPGAAQRIIESLNWLGIKFDSQPIYQSKRLEIYQEFAKKLVFEGKAYWCHCSLARLEKLRLEQTQNKIAPKYDGCCRDKNLTEQEGAVVRLKMPAAGETVINDLIRRKVIFKNELLDDPVLLKSDGYPTYHLANVVDDEQMKITHVIRSEEWLSSTPKHLILYQAFGWSAPQFAHLPMILGPDKSKLSKRHGATAVLEYKKQGYLPEALLNFIALLGWNSGTEKEIFSLGELIKEFSLERVIKSAAIFNLEKLNWLNGSYIRKMPLDKLTEMCVPYLESRGVIEKIPNPKSQIPNNLKFKIVKTNETVDFAWLKKIIALEQERMKTLDEIGEITEFFFRDKLEYPPELLKWKDMSDEELKTTLDILCDIIERMPKKDWQKETISSILLKEAAKFNDRGKLFWPLRVALTGKKASAGPFEIMEILGKEKILKRLEEARQKYEFSA